MPAINLPRLRIQSAKLMDYFDDPDGFLRELHNLLDIYADRTIRPGAISSPVVVLPTYRVSPSVVRHFEFELGTKTKNNPGPTLSLADKLWEDGYYESRSLAAFLLGQVSPYNEKYQIRLNAWVAETREPNISQLLISKGMVRMRKEAPELYLKQLEQWALPSRKKMWNSAINALLPLLKDKNFHNLPAVYNIAAPLIESAPATMQNELSILIGALYDSSPIETTFFLRQLITLATKPHTITNIRRILPTLQESLQKELREVIRLLK
jgi:DNA alkylation repair enzyme